RSRYHVTVRLLLAVIIVSTACLPPDKVEGPTVPPSGDSQAAAFAKTWLVENHIVAGNSTLTEGDAILMHGRKVDITPTSYRSPFQGSCDGATAQERTRSFDDVAAEVDLAGDRRTTAKNFGLTATVSEYRLTCNVNNRTPPLVLFVAGKRAMTCFSGVCYLLTPA
ncbi:MAG TPA: hypothetical protein VFQ65_04405, partial [Kofleriaceae bacterium]|nr:hypothetical protein [Kofleriaceae bacterium]